MDKDLNETLRALLQPAKGTLIPGAPNALAARIIENAGFDAVVVTGAGIANSYLGAPDIGLTTLNEVVDHIASIRDAVSLPIIADGDTGFGNAINMHRTVRMFERAGANAIQIEDQTFPKRCGHFEAKHVIPRDEMAQKIKAAVDARQHGMLIIARTDARSVEGMEAALDRARAYREAGADLLFVEAPVTVEELLQIPKSLAAPHLCNMVVGGKTPLLAREKLAEMGFAGIYYANAALQAAMFAMKQVMEHLRAHGSLEGIERSVISFNDRQAMVDFARYATLEKRYAASF